MVWLIVNTYNQELKAGKVWTSGQPCLIESPKWTEKDHVLKIYRNKKYQNQNLSLSLKTTLLK